MLSTTNLRAKVQNFIYESIPQHKLDSEPCSVGDLKTMVNNLANLLDEILEELDGIE